jgi:hypothetical protein
MDDSPGKKKEKSQPKSGGSEVDLTPHPIVKELLPDAPHTRDVVVLVGYLGPSKKEKFVRFYHDLDFQTYLEVPTDKILHHHPGRSALDIQPTKMVVEADAKLEFVQCLEASLLRGSIFSSYPVAAPTSGGVRHVIPFFGVCSGPVPQTHT